MECKDCAESMDGKPFGSCCSMCEERIRALDPPLDWDDEERVVEALDGVKSETFEHRRASAAFKGNGVEYDTGQRRFYLADRIELAVALELLKQRDAMCTKLAEALRVAHEAMETGTVYDSDMEVVEAALKEWEDGK